MGWIILIIYMLGFVASILALAKYGKQLDLDYSDNRDYEYDDWTSNKQAYTSFSILWPIFWFIHLLWGIWILLEKFTGLFIKDEKESEIEIEIETETEKESDEPEKEPEFIL